MRILCHLIVIFQVAISTAAIASTKVSSINSYIELAGIIQEIQKDTLASDILMVFDIDDTLLTSTNDLGSVSWFEWQRRLLEDNKNKVGFVKDFDDLLYLQTKLFYLVEQKPIENNILDFIRTWSTNGININIETARSPDMYAITRKQFDLVGFSLSTNLNDKAFKNYATFSLCKDESINPKNMLYRDGVYFVGGQDKGLSFTCLMQNSNIKFKHILFIDDQEYNINNFCRNVSKEFYENLQCIHYKKNYHSQKDFQTNRTRQQRTIELYKKLESTVSKLFSEFLM